MVSSDKFDWNTMHGPAHLYQLLWSFFICAFQLIYWNYFMIGMGWVGISVLSQQHFGTAA